MSNKQQNLKLIDPDAVTILTVGASEFHVKKLLTAERLQIIRKHTDTKTGKPDMAGIYQDFLELKLVNWHNVDYKGKKDVKFSKDLMPFLPPALVDMLVNEMGGTVEADDDDPEGQEVTEGN